MTRDTKIVAIGGGTRVSQMSGAMMKVRKLVDDENIFRIFISAFFSNFWFHTIWTIDSI